VTVRTWVRAQGGALCLLLLLLLTGAAWSQGSQAGEGWNSRALARVLASAPRLPSPLTVAVLGDSRDSGGVFDRLLEQMARDPDLAFAVHLGDLVPLGTEAGFQAFFRQVQQRLKIPLLAVLGNHELERGGGASLWDRLFGPRCYAFQVQGHFFLVLNDAPKNVDEGQLRWLTGELKQAQEAKTRLVFLHIPLFDPPGALHHHALPPALGGKLAALFRQYRVTHVFAGHIHGYFAGQWGGVPFAITGGGGVPLAGADPKHYFYHYLKVELAGDKVRVTVQRLADAPPPGEGKPKAHEK